MTTLRVLAMALALASLAACGGEGMPDVPTRRDVPNPRDVPNAVDVPTVIDVPNFDVSTVDVPNVPDVPNVIEDTGVCPMGTTVCAGIGCVDTQNDRANCGLCGVDCGLGRVCERGMCACAMGTTLCGGACVNLLSDTMNCGSCGRFCGANQMCVAGACQLNCPMPNSICIAGGIMSCVNLQSDPDNCNACNSACRSVNAASMCTNGMCGLGACNPGFGNCDNNAANGCEINTATNVVHCGGCGMTCPPRGNAVSSCVAGACTLTCNAGTANCDANDVNGCEINTGIDAANCGRCGLRCAVGQTCVAGVCQIGGAYRPVGPQNNVTVATVTNGGWTQCFLESFGAGRSLATLQATCNRANVMVACRTNGSATLQLLAWAPRADVFFNTGDGAVNRSNVRNSNGTAWYYSTSYSMGYARQGDLVNRSSCDFADMAGFPGSTVNPGLRMCIHTSAGNTSSGYRCGANTGLGATYERVFYHAN